MALDRERRLLFLDRRPGTPLADGRTLWFDADQQRLLVFDRHGRISEASGNSAVAVAQPRAKRTVSRTILEFSLAPVAPADPLIWITDENGDSTAVGSVEVPANAILGELTNAGWSTLADDGSSYFAAALRPEVRRYDPDGRLLWTITYPLAKAPPAPRLIADAGSLKPVFTTVQHGLAVGPDGRLYVLASLAGEAEPNALLAFNERGVWQRVAEVRGNDAIFADRAGRIETVPFALALAPAEPATRPELSLFSLPSVVGNDTLRLQDYRGYVVILNFWASWCGPCRQELPLLDQLARELAGQGVRVIGLNEDVNPDDARDFLRAVPVSFPSALGRGRLKGSYGYRGLPYTVVLDRELRVLKSIYGFGGDLGAIREAVSAELSRPVTAAGG
ncbi:MAG: redoxin domain-containing protein [Gemmatimonadota bacterium]